MGKLIEFKPRKPTGPFETQRTTEDYGDRIQRIRTSLKKINNLMKELKHQNLEKGD